MTPIEFILLCAVVALIGQIVILQMNYAQKFSAQAAVLNYLVDIAAKRSQDREELNLLRDRLFNSSH